MRRVALAALALSAALVAVPAAGAWTTLSGGVQNIVVPSMIVTQAGTELVSFESPDRRHDLRLARRAAHRR